MRSGRGDVRGGRGGKSGEGGEKGRGKGRGREREMEERKAPRLQCSHGGEGGGRARERKSLPPGYGSYGGTREENDVSLCSEACHLGTSNSMANCTDTFNSLTRACTHLSSLPLFHGAVKLYIV